MNNETLKAGGRTGLEQTVLSFVCSSQVLNIFYFFVFIAGDWRSGMARYYDENEGGL